MDGVHLSKEHEEDMRERFRQNNIDDIEEAVKQVKKWINEQPHLPSYTGLYKIKCTEYNSPFLPSRVGLSASRSTTP